MPEFAVMASTKFLCRFYSGGIIGFCAEEIAKYEKLTIKCRARCEPIKLVPELSKPRIVRFHCRAQKLDLRRFSVTDLGGILPVR